MVELWIIFLIHHCKNMKSCIVKSDVHKIRDFTHYQPFLLNFKDWGNCETQTKQGEIRYCQPNSQVLSCAPMWRPLMRSLGHVCGHYLHKKRNCFDHKKISILCSIIYKTYVIFSTEPTS